MHYFGICICGPNSEPHSLMAPFDENDEAFFIEKVGEDEHRDEYESGTEEFVVSPDGTSLFWWQSPYKPYWDGDEKVYPELPDGWEKKRLTFAEHYGDFSRFLEVYHGYSMDEERGVHIARYNPDGKYDYMRVGGRFQGYLKATDGFRVEEDCWEVADWRKKHPGESWYGEHDFDECRLDDLIKDEQGTPYFAVLPGGEWLEKTDWGEPDRFKLDGDRGEVGAFWREVVEPYLGLGCTAYAIDIHN